MSPCKLTCRVCLTQAYLTTRKQNKKFAVYDLNIVLDWQGHWAEEDKKVGNQFSSEPLADCFEVHIHSVYARWQHCSNSSDSLGNATCIVALQVKGAIKVSEFSSIDPEEYKFEVTVDAPDDATAAAANLKTAVQGLQGDILESLQCFVAELNRL